MARAQQFASSTVVLNSGDTLRGPLTMYLDRDLLLLTLPDGRVRTVPANEVRTFAVRGDGQPFDATANGHMQPLRSGRGELPWFGYNRARQFHVYRWSRDMPNANFTCPAFFELMSGGPVTLYRRCNLVLRRVPWADPTFWSPTAIPTRRLSDMYYMPADKYFLGTPDGYIVRLRQPKRDLLAYFAREARDIEKFARQHNLRFTDPRQLARLVDYANKLRPYWPGSSPVARRQAAAPSLTTQP
ncbi:hypothetical protein [Solirubrum puertoriconensis]|uniref:Uncharacterized protein n=1 Tax=Solirubrum puertoriconensis TaxID=1751427 RepID=A0A9X0HNZ0_SOLP1|nr:hypothetical protein [Solirubrum puertoriconensis]KUG09460.1 hypothetical protein ASU33_17190 [Solirubrum puertoriconensis]